MLVLSLLLLIFVSVANGTKVVELENYREPAPVLAGEEQLHPMRNEAAQKTRWKRDQELLVLAEGQKEEEEEETSLTPSKHSFK